MTYISYLLKTLDYKNLPGEFNSGNDLRNRDKNRYRDILPCKLKMVLFSGLHLGKDKEWVVWLSVLGILTCDRDEELWELAVGGLGIFLNMLEHGQDQLFYSRYFFQKLT